MPFADWKRETFEHPNASREATVVAKRGDQFVGYSSVWLPKQGVPVTIMTGVAPAERRHGVALALKLLTIRIVRSRGYSVMRTMNDTANPGILALNERLGYQPLPAWLAWEKQLRAP
jgi:predicted GNAT superfamily acetyltransferase